MGRNNQARRAAKARERRARRAAGGSAAWGMPGAESPGPSTPCFEPDEPVGPPRGLSDDERLSELIADRVGEAVEELYLGSRHGRDRLVTRVLELGLREPGRGLVVRHLRSALRICVETVWELGWQPADIHRFVGRQLGALGQQIVADQIADHLATFAASTIAPRWPAQLREIGATVWWRADTDPVTARVAALDGDFNDIVEAGLQVAALMLRVPPLEVLDPLPGTAVVTVGPAGPPVEERILSRVRALLAKAESTPYEAEAETFTAGAQSLMARHSIDAAMLASTGPARTAGPRAVRIGIDRPYERPKVALLQEVANANRCRCVWSGDLGFVTVVGHEPDLAAAETIFTSLLVQSVRAMTRASAGSRRGASGTRAFRAAFLSAFAQRIGERLRAATAEATEAALAAAGDPDDPTGSPVTGRPLGSTAAAGVLKVLDQRQAQVDDAVAALFPHLQATSLSGSFHPEGWTAGRLAADVATLFDTSATLGDSAANRPGARSDPTSR